MSERAKGRAARRLPGAKRAAPVPRDDAGTSEERIEVSIPRDATVDAAGRLPTSVSATFALMNLNTGRVLSVSGDGMEPGDAVIAESVQTASSRWRLAPVPSDTVASQMAPVLASRKLIAQGEIDDFMQDKALEFLGGSWDIYLMEGKNRRTLSGLADLLRKYSWCVSRLQVHGSKPRLACVLPARGHWPHSHAVRVCPARIAG
jgi:hypothetical protein